MTVLKKKIKKRIGVKYEILLGSFIQHRVFSILGIHYVDDVISTT